MYHPAIRDACSCLWLCLLTSTLAPASARAFNCCSVAKTGFSLCGAGGDCWSRESSGSAGVTEDVDFRGGIVVGLVLVSLCWLLVQGIGGLTTWPPADIESSQGLVILPVKNLVVCFWLFVLWCLEMGQRSRVARKTRQRVGFLNARVWGLAVMSTLPRHDFDFDLRFYNNTYYNLHLWWICLEKSHFPDVFIPLKLRSNGGKDGMPT